MNPSSLLPLGFALLLPLSAIAADPGATDGADAATLGRIREAAMGSDWAYQRLADLTDKIGPRLSGSPGAEAAVQQVAAAMNSAGLKVTLQPVKVPHWVRGEEKAELVSWPDQPLRELRQKIVPTALGDSSATPDEGLTLPVLVLHSFEELEARKTEVPGKIVVFDMPFDQKLADNGHAGQAYRQAGEYRFRGPNAASKLGAAALLLRAVGGADYRIPHTGATLWEDKTRHIPAAAIAAEDAMLIDRLAAQGPVTLHLTLTPRTLPDADSHNVLGDLVGSDKAEEVVLVSGHLDSWDLGTGAIDDGAGVISAMSAVALLKSLGLTPHRTIRAVAWMNEENGGRGGKAYFDSVKDAIATQSAAIESDSGAGRPLGIMGYTSPEAFKLLQPLMSALRPLGATVLDHREQPVGADITPLQNVGVPGFEPLLDGRHYFDYHHTSADTLDKVEPDLLKRQVALLAMLSWTLAELPEPLPRTAPADANGH